MPSAKVVDASMTGGAPDAAKKKKMKQISILFAIAFCLLASIGTVGGLFASGVFMPSAPPDNATSASASQGNSTGNSTGSPSVTPSASQGNSTSNSTGSLSVAPSVAPSVASCDAAIFSRGIAYLKANDITTDPSQLASPLDTPIVQAMYGSFCYGNGTNLSSFASSGFLDYTSVPPSQRSINEGRAVYELCKTIDPPFFDALNRPLFSATALVANPDRTVLFDESMPFSAMETGVSAEAAAQHFCSFLIEQNPYFMHLLIDSELAKPAPAPWANNTALEIPIDILSHWFVTSICALAEYGLQDFIVIIGRVLWFADHSVVLLENAVNAKIQDGTLNCSA